MTNTPDAIPPSPRIQALCRRRWPLLVTYLTVVLGGLTFAIFFKPIQLDWLFAVIALGAILLLQGLFLLGMPQLRWPKATRSVPMTVSIATGALLAALLTFGIAASLMNLVQVWEKVTDAVETNIFWIIAAAWGGWFFVFAIMWAGEWITVFNKIYRLLIAGTCLELLVTIPIDAHVRRRTSCYCGEGTFFAMIIGTSLAVWSFGPGLALLFLTRRLQLRGYYSACRECHYDLRGLDPTTKHCPECGTRIPERHRAMIQSAGGLL
jgi:hypothetical protein